MFEESSREKDRFKSTKGLLATEDLWDLPLDSGTKDSLNSVGQTLIEELDKAPKKSLVKKASNASAELERKLEIVKHIIEVKLNEDQAKANATANKEESDLITSILAAKQFDDLKGMSTEALLARQKELK